MTEKSGEVVRLPLGDLLIVADNENWATHGFRVTHGAFLVQYYLKKVK